MAGRGGANSPGNGDTQEAEEGRRVERTEDLVLKAKGQMQTDRIETIYVVTKWFQRKFRGECDSPSSLKIV